MARWPDTVQVMATVPGWNESRPAAEGGLRWYGRLRGQPISPAFKTSKEATDWRRQQAQLLAVKISSMTVRQFYVANREVIFADIKPATLAMYDLQWNKRVDPNFGERPIATLRFADIARWVKVDLPQAGCGLATIRQAFYTLNKILAYAVQCEVIAGNPAVGAFSSKGRLKKPERLRVIELEDVHRMADALPDRWRALMYVMAYGGLRYSEATGLHRSNVIEGDDFDGQLWLRVEGALARARAGMPATLTTPKSQAGYRDIPLPAVASKALRRHLRSWKPAGLLFTLENGAPVQYTNFTNRYWKPMLKELELAAHTTHDLRHTAVSLWFDMGASPQQVQEWVGHSSAAFTQEVYAHRRKGSSRRVMERMNEELDD